MNSPLENISPTTDNHATSDDGTKKSPPAFLDLADSVRVISRKMPRHLFTILRPRGWEVTRPTCQLCVH